MTALGPAGRLLPHAAGALSTVGLIWRSENVTDGLEGTFTTQSEDVSISHSSAMALRPRTLSYGLVERSWPYSDPDILLHF
jgi:hypothetical protein